MSQTSVVTAVADHLRSVDDAIARAAAKAGRNRGDTTLIAVSKVQPLDRIEAALQAGHRVFGENKVQEAMGKWPDFRSRYPDTELHLIGPLQTNKVRDAVALFDVIQTVDRPRLAARLAREIEATGKRPTLFIQVNTGEEPQKAGIMPADVDAFLEECRQVHKLDIHGLMCIPPVDETPGLHFALLADMAKRMGLKGLSMGMSADFETAIAYGATHVRVGTAVFGARDYGVTAPS